MKRIGNLYNNICNIENLKLADKNARKGKKRQHKIKLHDRNREDNIINLHHMLLRGEYKTSPYNIKKILDPKERDIYILPYYPDRIVHHSIMNIIKKIFLSGFTSDTYSCIEGKGIHGAWRKLKKSLLDIEGTKYCLKIDIKKFYPSINHDILKSLIRRKIKDKRLLILLDEIISSTPGVPIGNYLSQWFANFYLSYFDHWIKSGGGGGVKYYFRYCDDLIILASNKKDLHKLLKDIIIYLYQELKLEVNSNYQIFPVQKRGIDFIGYRFYHTHILLRDRIKKKFIRMIKYNKNPKSIASYRGWLIHCNSINLRKKYLDEKITYYCWS